MQPGHPSYRTFNPRASFAASPTQRGTGSCSARPRPISGGPSVKPWNGSRAAHLTGCTLSCPQCTSMSLSCDFCGRAVPLFSHCQSGGYCTVPRFQAASVYRWELPESRRPPSFACGMGSGRQFGRRPRAICVENTLGATCATLSTLRCDGPRPSQGPATCQQSQTDGSGPGSDDGSTPS